MSRPIGTAAELERRRKQAVQAVTGGQSRQTVAEVLGVHYKTVARWVRAARQPGGVDAKPPPAPAPGLTDAHLRRLAGLLAKGAKAHGWHNELWTAARVARLIERHFDISYHPEHVRKILKRRLGWTNRLVTGELERRWEAALRELRQAEEQQARAAADMAPDFTPLDPATRQALAEAGSSLPEWWRAGR